MEQEFDDLMKSIIKKKAPADFTSKTIQHISNQLEAKKVYRPIIPNGIWVTLAILFAGIMVFVFLNSSETKIDFDWFYLALENFSANLIYFIPLLVLLFMDGVARLKLNP